MDRYSVNSPPSLQHLVTQGVLPSVAVLGCGFSLPVCGFVRTFDRLTYRVRGVTKVYVCMYI